MYSQLERVFTYIKLQLLDAIEDEVVQGGYLIDWHACDLFPKSWIDLVVVLRCPSTSILYDRLFARYSPENFGILTRSDPGPTAEDIVKQSYKRTWMPKYLEFYWKRPEKLMTKRLWLS